MGASVMQILAQNPLNAEEQANRNAQSAAEIPLIGAQTQAAQAEGQQEQLKAQMMQQQMRDNAALTQAWKDSFGQPPSEFQSQSTAPSAAGSTSVSQGASQNPTQQLAGVTDQNSYDHWRAANPGYFAPEKYWPDWVAGQTRGITPASQTTGTQAPQSGAPQSAGPQATPAQPTGIPQDRFVAMLQKQVASGNLSAQGYQAALADHMQFLKNSMGLSKDQADLIQTTNNKAGAALESFDNLPPAQKTLQNWQQAFDSAQGQGAIPLGLTRDQVPTPDQLSLAYGKLNYTSEIAKLQESRATAAKAQADTAKAAQDTLTSQRQQALQDLSAANITDQPSLDAFRAAHPAIQGLLPGQWSPAAGQQIQSLIRSAVPIQQQPEFDINKLKAQNGIVGNDDFETVFLPAYAAKLGKTVGQMSPDEKLASFSAYTQAKSDPAVRASLLASRNLSQALQQMQLSQMPTPDQAKDAADMILKHQMAPEQMASLFGGFGTQGQAFKRMVVTEARKMDPNFNWEQAASEYELSKSPGFQNTVRYMDSVQNSMPQLQQRANQLSNGNVRSINALVNAGKNQFNNVDLKQFNVDRALVGDEIAKILQGGGTGNGTSDMKLKQAQDLISSSDSPQAIAATLNEVNKLIGYRRESLTRGTYMQNVPVASPQQVTPGARQAVGGYKIGGTYGNHKYLGGDPNSASSWQ